MRVLLDTHVLLWLCDEVERVPPAVVAMVGDPRNEVLVSAVTPWEIAIKIGKGHLALDLDALCQAVMTMGFRELPVIFAHSLALDELPPIHADPFDRMLIAQSRAEAVPLVTADRTISRYPVQTVWA